MTPYYEQDGIESHGGDEILCLHELDLDEFGLILDELTRQWCEYVRALLDSPTDVASRDDHGVCS